MSDLVRGIEKANAEDLELLLRALLSRYSVLYPDWELSTVSVLKSEDRNEQLDRLITILQQMKDL